MDTRILLFTTAIILTFCTLVWGQEESLDYYAASGDEDLAMLYGDEEFVSIATGSRKPIYKAPSVASVITAEEIEAMGARDLNDVLESVPGLHVSLSSLSRLDSVYSIRGIHTGFNPQVLMLMNGLPFQNLWSGGRPTLFRLPVASISRVEVIRGPGSAIYGADAFSGVINIITKECTDINGTNIGAREGSFNTRDFWIEHGRTYAGWDIAFTFEWQKSDGDDSRTIDSDSQTALDPVFSTSASLAPGSLSTRYEVFDSHLEIKRGPWNLRLWDWHLVDAGQGAGAAQALDPKGKHNVDQFLVDLGFSTKELASTPEWEVNTNLNYLYRKEESSFTLFPAGTVLPIGVDGNVDLTSPTTVTFPDGLLGNPGAENHHLGFDFSTLYMGFDDHRIRIGAGFKHQEFKPTEKKNFGPGIIDGTQPIIDGTLTSVTNTPFIYAPDESRTILFLSIQDEWQVAPDWELTAGIRYDDYSDISHTINPRLALVWATRHNLTTKLLYGSAFRAPSFSEQYAINNPVALGNKSLEPETIDTLELAFDYRPTFDLHFGLSIYTYTAKDLIEFIQDAGGTTSTAQNARDQKGHGFEFEWSWTASEKLTLQGNYAWQDSEFKETNEDVADAPGQQLYLKAKWDFYPRWSLNSQLNWVGDRKREINDPRSAIDDYTLVDITLRKKELFDLFDFAITVKNLFDENAQEPSDGQVPNDYPLEGRNFWAEVRYKF